MAEILVGEKDLFAEHQNAERKDGKADKADDAVDACHDLRDGAFGAFDSFYNGGGIVFLPHMLHLGAHGSADQEASGEQELSL